MGILTSTISLVFAEAKPNRFYAEIVGANREKKTYLIDLNGKNTFTVGRRKYNIDLADENVITYTGFWRVPTAEYIWNIKEPLQRGLAIPADGTNPELRPISAEDAYEATESHVVSETLKSFMPELISQTTSFFLLMIAVVAGPVILYVTLNMKLKEILELAAQLAAAQGIQLR